MKIRPTPLFLVSAGLILYGLYLLIFVDPGEEGWGTLFALVIGGAGVVGIFVYAILRGALKSRIWTQVGIETILIAGVLYFGYKKSGFFEFRLPHDYRGYVMLVYGVDNAPPLNTPFYSNKIKVNVPSSGIILTSSLPNDNYPDPAEFLDSTIGEIDRLPVSLKRYGLPLSSDTLECDGNKYLFDLWIIKEEPAWSSSDDTIYRLDRRIFEACALIRQ